MPSILRSRIICVACGWTQNRDTFTSYEIVDDGADVPPSLATNVGADMYCRMLGEIRCENCGPLDLEVRRRWHGEHDRRTQRQAAKPYVTVHGTPRSSG